MKWFWKKMWLGFLEALEQWLKNTDLFESEDKPLSKDRATQRAVESKVGTLTVDSSAAMKVSPPGIVKQQAHEILKGRR